MKSKKAKSTSLWSLLRTRSLPPSSRNTKSSPRRTERLLIERLPLRESANNKNSENLQALKILWRAETLVWLVMPLHSVVISAQLPKEMFKVESKEDLLSAMFLPQLDNRKLSLDKEWVLMEVLLFNHVSSKSLNQSRLVELSRELLREPHKLCPTREFTLRQEPVSQQSKCPQIELDRWLYPQSETKENNIGFPQPKNTMFNMCTMKALLKAVKQ